TEDAGGTRPNGTSASQDRGSRSSASHPADRVLRSARQQRLRSEGTARGYREGGQRGSLRVESASKADAGEVEGDQAAVRLGSRKRSRRVDWPVLLPVRQPVPRQASAIEHAWKDGDPRYSNSTQVDGDAGIARPAGRLGNRPQASRAEDGSFTTRLDEIGS